MTAPDQCCRNVRKLLPGRRPHVTHSDNLQPSITALRKDHSIILSAMDQDKPGRLHELDAQVTIAALRNFSPRSCGYWELYPLRGCLSD
jgi:hypothetical protein